MVEKVVERIVEDTKIQKEEVIVEKIVEVPVYHTVEKVIHVPVP